MVLTVLFASMAGYALSRMKFRGRQLVFILMLAGQLGGTLSLPFLLISLLIASGHALTMLCLYVFSAYLGRMYLEVKGRPPYIIMEVVTRLKDTNKGRQQ